MSKEDFLKAARRPPVEFQVEAIGQSVHLRRLTSAQVSALFGQINSGKGDSNAKKMDAIDKMVAESVVDPESGEPWFDSTTVKCALDFDVRQDIYNECMRLNGLSGNAQEEAGNS